MFDVKFVAFVVTEFSGRQPSRFQGPIRPRHCEEFATANDAAIQDVREEIATPIRLRREPAPAVRLLRN
jgi:hypothetical protein